MTSPTEKDRFYNKLEPDPMPTAYWDGLLDLGEQADDVVAAIFSVVEIIMSYDYRNWPEEDEWLKILPKWVSDYIPLLNVSQMNKILENTPKERWDDLPWEFGSWLDALRERKWKWWGFERKGSRIQIVLEMTDIPPRIDAFKQIPLAAGAKILSEVWEPQP